MNDKEALEKDREITKGLLTAIDEWSIERRIQLVRSAVFDRHGSFELIPPERPTEQQDITMYYLVDILDGVIQILKNHPEAGNLPNPPQP